MMCLSVSFEDKKRPPKQLLFKFWRKQATEQLINLHKTALKFSINYNIFSLGYGTYFLIEDFYLLAICPLKTEMYFI